MMTFSDAVPEASVRYQLAWFFIVIVSINVLFHLLSLAKSMCRDLLNKCKLRKYKRGAASVRKTTRDQGTQWTDLTQKERRQRVTRRARRTLSPVKEEK